MEQHLSVLRALFFLLLTKQLISKYFFNSLIRKSVFNLTHYQATHHHSNCCLIIAHSHANTHVQMPRLSMCPPPAWQGQCLCEKTEGVLELWLAGDVGTVTSSRAHTQSQPSSFPLQLPDLQTGPTTRASGRGKVMENNKDWTKLLFFPPYCHQIIGLCNNSHHSYLMLVEEEEGGGVSR